MLLPLQLIMYIFPKLVFPFLLPFLYLFLSGCLFAIKSNLLNPKLSTQKSCVNFVFFNRLLKLLFHSIQRFKATYIFLFAVILSRFLKKSTLSHSINKNEILCCFLCIFQVIFKKAHTLARLSLSCFALLFS